MSVLSSVNFIVSNYNISAEKKRVYTNINYPNQICLHGLKSLDFFSSCSHTPCNRQLHNLQILYNH